LPALIVGGHAEDVLRTDQLNDQGLLDTDEVDHEGTDGVLASEPVTFQTSRTQQPGESVFRVIAAKPPGSIREQLYSHGDTLTLRR
jgi:hypothetical protein